MGAAGVVESRPVPVFHVPAIAAGISAGFPPLLVFSSENLAACQAGAFPRPGVGVGTRASTSAGPGTALDPRTCSTGGETEAGVTAACREQPLWGQCPLGVAVAALGRAVGARGARPSPLPCAPQCWEVRKHNSSEWCHFIRTNPDCRLDGGFLDYLDGVFCVFPPRLLPLAVTLYVRTGRGGAGDALLWGRVVRTC